MPGVPSQPSTWSCGATGGRGAADVAVPVQDRAGAARLCAGDWSSLSSLPDTSGTPRPARRAGPGPLVSRRAPHGHVDRALPGLRWFHCSGATLPAFTWYASSRPASSSRRSNAAPYAVCACPSARRTASSRVRYFSSSAGVFGTGPKRSDIRYGEPRRRRDRGDAPGRPVRGQPVPALPARSARARARATSAARSRRVAAPTIRSRSLCAASISSGPISPPTSAPRLARSVRSVTRRSRSWCSAIAAFRVAAGSLATRSLIRSTCARSCRSSRRQVGVTGFERELGPQRRGQRVRQSACLRQRNGQRAGRAAGVQATPDQGRDPLGLGRPDPAGVPGHQDQLVPVRDRLPHRHRRARRQR